MNDPSICFATLHQAVDQWVKLHPDDELPSQKVQGCLEELHHTLAHTRQQAQQTAALNQLVRTMRGSLVVEEVLQLTVEQLHEVLKVDRCLIFRPDQQQQMQAHHVSEATQERESLLGVYCDFYRYYRERLSQGESLAIAQFAAPLPQEVHQFAASCAIQSLLIVPLIHQGHYLGGISLHQCHQTRSWTIEEITFVEAVADHCAIALHQAELYRQLQQELVERRQLEAELESRVERRTMELQQVNHSFQAEIIRRQQIEQDLRESQNCLRLISYISTSVAARQSPEQVIESTVSRLGQYFPHLRVHYSVIEDSRVKVMHTVQPATMPSLADKVWDLNTAPDYLLVLERRQPLVVSNVTEDERLEPIIAGLLGQKTLAVLAMSVQHSDRQLGMLCFNAPTPYQWSKYEVTTLTEIAEYLSMFLLEAQAQQERQRAEVALRESEFKLRMIIENSTDAISLKDQEGRYLLINPAGARLMGHSPEEILGKRDEELFCPEVGQAIWQNDWRVIISGQTQTYEEAIEIRGVQQTFLSTKVPYQSHRKEFLGLIGICRNITQQKQVEDSLRRQLAAIETATDGIAILDRQGCYTYLNDAYVRLFDYASATDLLGQTWRQVYPPEETQHIEQEIFSHLIRDGQWQGETTAKCRGGNLFMQELSLTLLEDGGIVCVCRDITKRKQAEERLRLFESAVVNANDAVLITTADPNQPIILYTNEAFTRITGYSASEVIGKTPRLLQGIRSDRSRLEQVRATLQRGEAIQTEVVNYRKDGTEYWVDLNIVPLFDQQGHLTHFVAIQRDITERKWSEELLLATQARLKYLLSSSPAIIYTCKPTQDYACTFVSENITQQLGYEVWQYLKYPGFWMEHIHPDDRATVVDSLAQLGEVDHLTCEYRFLHQDQTYRWLRDTRRLLKDPYHQPIEVIGSVLDITARKQVEEALRYSEEQFRQLFDEAPLGMSLVDLQYRYLRTNHRFQEMLDYNEVELREIDFSSLTYPEDLEQELPYTDELQRGLIPRYQLEKRYRKRNGDLLWVNLTVTMIRNSLGQPLALLGMAEDITERRQAEEQIRTSLAEKVVMLKEIHHRVKNNLQVISSLLKLQSGYVKDQGSLEVLKESQNRVRAMALIHEKLYQSEDLARSNFTEYIRSLVNDLFRSYTVHTRSIQLHLDIANIQLNLDTAIPCGLMINELVSNSLKYAFANGQAENLGIQLTSTLQQQYVLTVWDDGPGLPPEVDFRHTSSLGLQLVCSLVRQLQGSIELDCTQGTRFHIIFAEQKQKV